MISSDDTKTLATINTDNIGVGKTPVVVTVPPVITKTVATIISKKKD